MSAKFAAPAGELQVLASIRQPAPASWPTFWMLGAGFRASGAGTSGTMNCAKWPSVGEIDIMEDVNALSQLAGTLHCGTYPGGPCNEGTGLGSGLQPCTGCQAGYHTYSVIVNRDEHQQRVDHRVPGRPRVPHREREPGRRGPPGRRQSTTGSS